jgi:phosphate transport system substrate-binding protein
MVTAEFEKSQGEGAVKLSSAGTVEGFARFCHGEIDIVDASRSVTAAEIAACGYGSVEFIELPVAYDALTIIVNAGNTWATSITVSELRKLWEPTAEKSIGTWKQVRAEWPDRPIKLFGPGAESGTFDYLTLAVVGTLDASRKDYTATADDSVIVTGVASDAEALGYVGYGYFDRNRKVVKALAVDDEDDSIGRGAIEPSPEAVGRGVYRPLSRPLFVYVNKARLTRPEVKSFVDTYLRKAIELAAGAGTMPLTGNSYKLAMQRLAKGTTGTMYKAPEDARLGVDLLMER